MPTRFRSVFCKDFVQQTKLKVTLLFAYSMEPKEIILKTVKIVNEIAGECQETP